MTIRVGTCAWADHQRLYPKHVKPAERLAYYSQYFSLVEVDSTYYGIPQRATVQEWVRQTPADFRFDVKAYRTFTLHDRGAAPVDEVRRQMRDFMDALDVLADAGKLGMVLFQFPPWFVPSLKHVHYVEQIVEAFSSYAVAIEFRHRSWFSNSARASTLRWLRELRAVNVVCDEPQIGNGTIPLVADVTNSRYVMFRLHGRNEQTWYQKGLASSQQRFDYLYGKDELTALLPMVQRWAHQVSEVHVLMNNNQADYAVTNAQDWQALLGQPVRSREVERVESKQLSLFDGESL